MFDFAANCKSSCSKECLHIASRRTAVYLDISKMVPKAWFILPILFLLQQELGVDSAVSDTLRRVLKNFSDDADRVFEHSNVSTGVDHDGLHVEVRQGWGEEEEESANHEAPIEPPFIGSFCDYKEYSKWFDPYYATPFIRQDKRLFFNRQIHKRFGLENSDEFAWRLCQFGGIKLECTENARCACLNQAPPDAYIETEYMTCVGAKGSVCNHLQLYSILCDEGLECIDGYCGGIEALAERLGNGGLRHNHNVWPIILLSGLLRLVVGVVARY